MGFYAKYLRFLEVSQPKVQRSQVIEDLGGDVHFIDVLENLGGLEVRVHGVLKGRIGVNGGGKIN